MNTYLKNDYGTKPHFCENCGEGMNFEMYQLLDGFENLHPSIEEICEYCLSDYIREFGK